MASSISQNEFLAPPTTGSVAKLFLDELASQMEVAFFGGPEEMDTVLNDMVQSFSSYLDTNEPPEILLPKVRNAWNRLDILKNGEIGVEDSEQAIVSDLLNAISIKGISKKYSGIRE